jgi:hypothetical protein
VIEIGQRLAAAKLLCKQAGEPWLPWLQRQFSWTSARRSATFLSNTTQCRICSFR